MEKHAWLPLRILMKLGLIVKIKRQITRSP